MTVQLPEVRLPLTFQRLIMSAGASRDFAPAHIDPDAARAGGAPGAYADVMFVLAMFERCVGEWAGGRGTLQSLNRIALQGFVLAGEDVVVRGVVTQECDTSTTVDLVLVQAADRRAASATAVVRWEGA